MTMMQENNNAQAIMGYNGVSGIAERMAAMDEEMKMLKEALACRNQELQNAQIRCAQTANRLSVVEEELDRALGGGGGVQQNQLQAAAQQDTAAKGHLIKGSHCSVDKSNGEDAASDAWASGLVAELGQFKKEKKSKVHNNTSNGNNDKGSPAAASLSLELMDDFVEMERLTKMSAPGRSENMTYSDTASLDGPPQESPMITATSDYQIQELEGALASTRQELDLANTKICDLNVKLATTEEQLTALQARNSTNEDLLIKLQNQLNRLNEIQLGMEKAADNRPPVVFPDQKSRFSIKDILTRRKESGLAAGSRSKTSESSEECDDDTAEEHATVSDAESKASPYLFCWVQQYRRKLGLLKIQVHTLEFACLSTGKFSLISLYVNGMAFFAGKHSAFRAGCIHFQNCANYRSACTNNRKCTTHLVGFHTN
jgi:hypothetical protein